MIRDIKHAIHRSSSTLIEDMLGASALVVMLMAGLHLPGLL